MLADDRLARPTTTRQLRRPQIVRSTFRRSLRMPPQPTSLTSGLPEQPTQLDRTHAETDFRDTATWGNIDAERFSTGVSNVLFFETATRWCGQIAHMRAWPALVKCF